MIWCILFHLSTGFGQAILDSRARGAIDGSPRLSTSVECMIDPTVLEIDYAVFTLPVLPFVSWVATCLWIVPPPSQLA